MNDAEIKRQRAVIAAATPGPWKPDVGVYQDLDGDDDLAFARGPMIHRKKGETYRGLTERGGADAAFLAAARTDWPRCLDEIERLRVRQQDLLATIVKLTRDVPYEEEKNQVSVLIAEVGTLRAELARLRTAIFELADIYDSGDADFCGVAKAIAGLVSPDGVVIDRHRSSP